MICKQQHSYLKKIQQNKTFKKKKSKGGENIG